MQRCIRAFFFLAHPNAKALRRLVSSSIAIEVRRLKRKSNQPPFVKTGDSPLVVVFRAALTHRHDERIKALPVTILEMPAKSQKDSSDTLRVHQFAAVRAHALQVPTKLGPEQNALGCLHQHFRESHWRHRGCGWGWRPPVAGLRFARNATSGRRSEYRRDSRGSPLSRREQGRLKVEVRHLASCKVSRKWELTTRI